jgi:membrane-associated phospholipid phosphatase
MGPLVGIDAFFNISSPPPGWRPVLHVMDRIGQRAICLPVLTIATVVCCRFGRSWRPAWLALGSVLFLNFVVGVLKLSLGRAEPVTANPSFFSGGMAYPSGHTGNILLVYGMAVYLLSRYRGVPRRVQYALWAAVCLLSVLMVATSLTLTWHWFADLVAGLLIGASVLELGVAIDATLPAAAFTRAPWQVLASLRPRVRRSRPAVPEQPRSTQPLPTQPRSEPAVPEQPARRAMKERVPGPPEV